MNCGSSFTCGSPVNCNSFTDGSSDCFADGNSDVTRVADFAFFNWDLFSLLARTFRSSRQIHGTYLPPRRVSKRLQATRLHDHRQRSLNVDVFSLRTLRTTCCCGKGMQRHDTLAETFTTIRGGRVSRHNPPLFFIAHDLPTASSRARGTRPLPTGTQTPIAQG